MKAPTCDSDHPLAVLGVPGRLTHRTTKPGREPECWFKQRWVSEGRKVNGYGTDGVMEVGMRFDDELHNRHNSFSITATVVTNESRKRKDIAAGGCLHEDIAAVFPELAPLIKWHLTGTNGPMHYVANTTYHASNRCHYGKLKGEPTHWDEGVKFDNNPIVHRVTTKFWKWIQDCRKSFAGPDFDFGVVQYDHEDRGKPGMYQFAPKYTFGGFGTKWYDCPFDTQMEAMAFLKALQTCNPQFVKTPTMFSEGKARNLDAARECAVWPEATDEQLMLEKPELEALLLARLPALLAEFRADMETVGFLWEPPT